MIAAAMEGIHASIAALDALSLQDARLGADGSGVDVLQRGYELRLDRMAAVALLEAQLAALKARDAAETVELQHAMTPPDAPVHERTYAEMSAVEEIAAVLTISSAAAGALVTQSRQLCSLPLALDALSAGTISWQHVKIIANETDNLGPAGAANLVAHFLDPDSPNPARGAAAGELVPSRFRTKVSSWRERHHPESLEIRHTKSVADRRVEYSPDRENSERPTQENSDDGPDDAIGLASLAATDTEATSTGTGTNTKTSISTSTSTSTSLHDAATGPASGKGYADIATVPVPNAQVLVTVPVFALLGLTDEPAILDGYGPIPASMARQLLTDGANSFHRVLVDPRDGAPLEIGRTSYRLTKAMKQALRLRDGKCTFPGCNNNSSDNEIDHLQAWHHGGT